jgi:hypothetical protein
MVGAFRGLGPWLNLSQIVFVMALAFFPLSLMQCGKASIVPKIKKIKSMGMSFKKLIVLSKFFLNSYNETNFLSFKNIKYYEWCAQKWYQHLHSILKNKNNNFFITKQIN